MGEGKKKLQCNRCKSYNMEVSCVLDAEDEILQLGGCPREVHPEKVDICPACLAEAPPHVQEAAVQARERKRYMRIGA